MGKRGPAPQPAEILRARGSTLAKRRAKLGPASSRVRPACPEWLDLAARRSWKEIVPLLDAAGLLSKIDRNVLARYCQTWARWVAAEVELAGGQLIEVTTTRRDGSVTTKLEAHPASVLADRLSSQLGRLEGKLGISPADRVRVVADRPMPIDESVAEFA